MLEFPIIDSHVHLWDPRHLEYAWQKDLPVLDRPFLPSDYQAACGPHAVDKLVFVECDIGPGQHVKEADWVRARAAEDSRICAIVAGAPVERGEAVRPFLDDLQGNPLVKGVRRIIQFEADMGFCLQSEFINGLKILPEYGFSFDICIAHQHLANTIRMVEQCPGVSFILDHIAKPDIRSGMKDPWRGELKTLAGYPNVVCKLSGLVTEADNENWSPADLTPYIEHTIESFGFDRLMFGGDWPVIVQASALHRWMDTLQEILSGTDEEDLKKLFRKNAEAAYRI